MVGVSKPRIYVAHKLHAHIVRNDKAVEHGEIVHAGRVGYLRGAAGTRTFLTCGNCEVLGQILIGERRRPSRIVLR